ADGDVENALAEAADPRVRGDVGPGRLGPGPLQVQPVLPPAPATGREQPAEDLPQVLRPLVRLAAPYGHAFAPQGHVSGITRYEYVSPQRNSAGLAASFSSTVNVASDGR